MFITRALFPISLSNQRYSTNSTIMMLQKIPHDYEEILFIVADHLQLYNKALLIDHPSMLGSIVRKFQKEQRYLLERQTWFDRLRSKFPDDETRQWRISGLEDFMDAACFKIFRNVMLAYYSIDEFRNDLDLTARTHAALRKPQYPWIQRVLLSKGYILEELALSIRIKLLEKIFDEFYIDPHPKPVIKLYRGDYNFSVYDLAEVEKSKARFRFYYFTESSVNPLWEEQKNFSDLVP